MQNKGFVCLYRDIENWEWFDDLVTYKVFTCLILFANYKPMKWHEITVERGQIIISRDKFAKRLNISTQQLRTSLSKLEQSRNITKETTKRYTLITVENYEKFQGDKEMSTQRATQQSTNNQPAINQQSTKTKERKNSNKEKNINNTCSIAEKFDAFWNSYPKKVARKRAYESFKKIDPDDSQLEIILNAVEAQKQMTQWNKDGGQFIPMPVTWLNQERWNDELPEIKNNDLAELWMEFGNDETGNTESDRALARIIPFNPQLLEG